MTRFLFTTSIITLLTVGTLIYPFDASFNPQNGSIIKQKFIPFSYDILNKTKVPGKKIDINRAKIIKKKEVSRSGQSNTMVREKFSSDPLIESKTYLFSEFKAPYAFRATISIGDSTYLIDSLYYGDKYSTERPIQAMIDGIYKFDFSQRKFVAIFISDFAYSCTQCNYLILLFDITGGKVKYIPLMFQASEDLACFGDFNEDNKLDFAYWENGTQGKVISYSLEGNIFIKNPNKYILLKDINGSPNVDVTNSKWFFQL